MKPFHIKAHSIKKRIPYNKRIPNNERIPYNKGIKSLLVLLPRILSELLLVAEIGFGDWPCLPYEAQTLIIVHVQIIHEVHYYGGY